MLINDVRDFVTSNWEDVVALESVVNDMRREVYADLQTISEKLSARDWWTREWETGIRNKNEAWLNKKGWETERGAVYLGVYCLDLEHLLEDPNDVMGYVWCWKAPKAELDSLAKPLRDATHSIKGVPGLRPNGRSERPVDLDPDYTRSLWVSALKENRFADVVCGIFDGLVRFADPIDRALEGLGWTKKKRR